MCIPIKSKLLKAISQEIPTHKENKRIWISTDKIHDTTLAENLTYHYEINTKKKQLKIISSIQDNRKITLRKNNLPIIDINNKEISDLYKGIKKITIKIYQNKIIIEPLKEELHQQKARSKLNTRKIKFFDIFSGGGTLSKALSDSGMTPVGAVEIEDKYLQNYEKNNQSTFSYNTDITNIDYALLPKDITILTGGIPCEDYTPCGIAKKCSLRKKTKEAGSTGSLGYFFLQAVENIRPAIVLIEEVVGFKNSAMADIIRAVLSMRGYQISEKILKAPDYGSMTKRKRYCMVATISKNPFKFSTTNTMNFRTVNNILEVPIANRIWLDKENSKSIAYSLKAEEEHIAKGKGFRLARTYLNDDVTATITKGYYKNQLTNPILVHPNDESRFSWFTPRELARLNGLPENFILPDVKSNAGEIIGQGISYEVFYSVARDIIHHLKNERV